MYRKWFSPLLLCFKLPNRGTEIELRFFTIRFLLNYVFHQYVWSARNLKGNGFKVARNLIANENSVTRRKQFWNVFLCFRPFENVNECFRMLFFVNEQRFWRMCRHQKMRCFVRQASCLMCVFLFVNVVHWHRLKWWSIYEMYAGLWVNALCVTYKSGRVWGTKAGAIRALQALATKKALDGKSLFHIEA